VTLSSFNPLPSPGPLPLQDLLQRMVNLRTAAIHVMQAEAAQAAAAAHPQGAEFAAGVAAGLAIAKATLRRNLKQAGICVALAVVVGGAAWYFWPSLSPLLAQVASRALELVSGVRELGAAALERAVTAVRSVGPALRGVAPFVRGSAPFVMVPVVAERIDRYFGSPVRTAALSAAEAAAFQAWRAADAAARATAETATEFARIAAIVRKRGGSFFHVAGAV
jgi:hypothetical protein